MDVTTVAGCAARAELGWRDTHGRLQATAFVPLVIGDAVVAALPFAEASTAGRLDGVATATVVFSDSRMALKGWTACAVPVTVDVCADRAGDWTWSGALDQEVRKYPPSRLLVDTAIQRREHWWYVPRWIVRMRPADLPVAVARRQAPEDGVLFDGGPPAPAARTVAVEDWDAAQIRVTPLDADPLAGSSDDAVLFSHDFSVPDQERASQLAVHGRRAGRIIDVARRDGDLQMPAPRLLHRVRAHYHLERTCRRALADYDAGSSSAAAT